jgi:Family of unknown function (DUF6088)
MTRARSFSHDDLAGLLVSVGLVQTCAGFLFASIVCRQRPTVPDYRAVIRAVARRDPVRVVIDGMTAANDLGLTTAVPARIEVLADARLKPIKVGGQEIHFKFSAPSRLYWADRPAMRVVQALYWMQDMLTQDGERQRVETALRRLFADPQHGPAIRDDLRAGFFALPIWMQEAALADRALGADCVRHARMFFDRPDYDLASAVPGTTAIAPVGGMVDALRRDCANSTAMIFGILLLTLATDAAKWLKLRSTGRSTSLGGASASSYS